MFLFFLLLLFSEHVPKDLFNLMLKNFLELVIAIYEKDNELKTHTLGDFKL